MLSGSVFGTRANSVEGFTRNVIAPIPPAFRTATPLWKRFPFDLGKDFLSSLYQSTHALSRNYSPPQGLFKFKSAHYPY